MGNTTLGDTGSIVFNGNPIKLNAKKITYSFNSLVPMPTIPAAGSLAELDYMGFKNPIIRVEGVINGSKTHVECETGSEIDFYFLREFAARPSGNPPVMKPKEFKHDLIASGGSTIWCKVNSFSIPIDAKTQPAAGAYTYIPYTLELIEDSGTYSWW